MRKARERLTHAHFSEVSSVLDASEVAGNDSHEWIALVTPRFGDETTCV
jgi:hypothetical protein